ncbi:MAE_28990/MAE_18760 family HEPN-like nuclease [Photobacterium sp. J15]|uniref:MAE_28990/MAE_18760 family HEPN-like nuclease n=1 Tax=Photobacterium sp. J15 TaxID=265901 RepID=UPI0007E2E157|nr:MAE_28990/MAE_18760 family HEPN-like nuclease [Photobacterium sp. J15]
MFDDIDSGVMNRLRQLDSILEFLLDETLPEETKNSDFYRAQKGLVFVAMYAALEFAITQSVTRALEIIGREEAPANRFKSSVLCSLFDSHFKALRECGSAKVWEHRYNLVLAVTGDTEVTNVDSSVFPSGGSMNISIKQLENVWKFFDLDSTPLPEGVQHFVLTEIKEHRNAIAHGRETAITIGRRFNVTQLSDRSSSIKHLCLHITSTFASYCTDKRYFIADTVA